MIFINHHNELLNREENKGDRDLSNQERNKHQGRSYCIKIHINEQLISLMHSLSTYNKSIYSTYYKGMVIPVNMLLPQVLPSLYCSHHNYLSLLFISQTGTT